MLNEYEFLHLSQVRKVPHRKFITLERIEAEQKLLAKATTSQQIALYGYCRPEKRRRIKHEKKMGAHPQGRNARSTPRRDSGQMGSAPIRVEGIAPGAPAVQGDTGRRGERMAVFQDDVRSISMVAL